MMWGAIIGGCLGLVVYVFRAGGVLFLRDMQSGFFMVIIQAILHALTPAAIGGFIGWLIA